VQHEIALQKLRLHWPAALSVSWCPSLIEGRYLSIRVATLLLILCLGACRAVPPTVQMPTLELINWNTYHLFDHQLHQESATAWLAQQQPAMVALQEVLHVDSSGLSSLAEKWGHPYAVMHKESGYPVALTSSAPIEVVERRVAGFHHGYLHARTHGFDVLVVHFWPGKIHEPQHIAKLALDLVSKGKRVLVVGDYNGEIRHDHEYLLEHGQLGEVVDGVRTFDYRITDTFLESGFVDLTHAHAPTARYTFGSPALIPRWRKDMEDVQRTRRRIDYIFADPSTAERAISARVVTDDSSVGQWSDHYPVGVTFAP